MNALASQQPKLTQVKSAGRVLDLLEMIASSPTPLSLSDIARRLAIPKSSTSALLETLVVRGYVLREDSGLYRLSSVLAAGWIGGPGARLLGVARPVMHRVSERTGESVFLGVLTDDLQVKYLDKVVSSKAVRYDAEMTAVRAAHATSIGKVLLAFLPEPARQRAVRAQRLQRFTARTITSPQTFAAELGRISREGHAINVDERVTGAAGVAAPIFDAQARVVAALNVSAPTSRFHPAQAQMTRWVLWGAGAISRLLQPAGAPTTKEAQRPSRRRTV